MNEKINILLADDNENLCQMLVSYFNGNSKFEIVGVAITDEEERKMIEELKPNIVISDLKRGSNYTGLNIIKEYSNNIKSPDFLVMSADSKIEVIRNFENVVGYINKPFINEELLRKLNNLSG